jgi:hypothetical protein
MKNLLCVAALAALSGTALGQDSAQTVSIAQNANLLQQQYNPSRVAGSVVWDSMIGQAAPTTTTGTPRTYINGAIGSLAGSGPLTLTGLDATVVNSNATTTSINGVRGLRLNFTIWGGFGTGTLATDLVYTNQLAQASADFTFATPFNFAGGTYIPVGNDFAAGPNAATAGVDLSTLNIVLPNPAAIAGITFNWQLDLGAGFVATQAGLTTGLIAGTTPQTIGVNGFASPGGFFRNAGPRASYADGNFINSDARSFAGVTNTTVAYRLYATPTPGAASLLAVAGLVAGRRRRA